MFAARPPEALPEESPYVGRDSALLSQLPPSTSRLPVRKPALPSRHRTIPPQSLRLQMRSGATAEPSIHVDVLREPAAHRNAFGTPPPSLAFHSTTLNRDPVSPSSGPVALARCQSDARISAFRWLSPPR